MKSSIIAGMLAVLAVSACAEGGNTVSQDVISRGDTVLVNVSSPVLSRIKTAEAETITVPTEFRTFGTVQARNGNFAQVCTPFDGRIVSSHIRLGQRVKTGDVLFELSSSEYLDNCKAYLQAVHTYDNLKAEYARKKELKEAGIVSERELQEVFTNAENARHDKEFAEATLKVFGADPSKVQLGETMKILAPISGEIVENDVTTGAYLKADGDAPVTIADLREVWINAMVKERYIGKVMAGGTAEIITEADSDNVFTGKILNIGNIVDEESRSIHVVITCANPEMKLKHGMYVAVKFLDEESHSIVLPSTSVFQGDNRSYVYVRTDEENVFVKRTVTAGSVSGKNDLISILSGLDDGDVVVTEGGLYLND